MTSFADVLAAAKPREAVAWILLDQTLLDRQAELDAAATAAASTGDQGRAVELSEQVLEVQEQIATGKTPFRFVGIGYRRWMDLLRDHPPTKSQTGVDHNPDTFPVAAVAASCVDPVMTVDEVTELVNAFTLAQWEALWYSCLLANKGGDQDPKSMVAAGLIRRRNGASAPRATSSASPAASSSAE